MWHLKKINAFGIFAFRSTNPAFGQNTQQKLNLTKNRSNYFCLFIGSPVFEYKNGECVHLKYTFCNLSLSRNVAFQTSTQAEHLCACMRQPYEQIMSSTDEDC